MHPALFTFGLVFFLSATDNQLPACSCAEITPRQAFEKADLVFSGVVIKLRLLDKKKPIYPGKGQAVLKSLKVWKGKVGKTMTLYTELPAGPCDVWEHAKMGEAFLIYANYVEIAALYNKGHVFYRLLITDRCARSVPINSANAAADLKFLGPGKNP